MNGIKNNLFYKKYKNNFNHFVFCFRDRKSTRLNSSHANISYAVFCLKKNTKNNLKMWVFKADLKAERLEIDCNLWTFSERFFIMKLFCYQFMIKKVVIMNFSIDLRCNPPVFFYDFWWKPAPVLTIHNVWVISLLV